MTYRLYESTKQIEGRYRTYHGAIKAAERLSRAVQQKVSVEKWGRRGYNDWRLLGCAYNEVFIQSTVLRRFS